MNVSLLASAPVLGGVLGGVLGLSCVVFNALLTSEAPAQAPGQDWALPPIEYGKNATTDRVALLKEAIDAGDFTWKELGRADARMPLSIEAVLEALDVSATSQTTVFSRTSMQAKQITPSHPRALYFSEDVYVGYVPRGDLIELTAVDKSEGLVFYTLDRRAERPSPKRETHRCLQCHAPPRAGGFPAHLLRSVHPAMSGEPRFASGTQRVDQTTPYASRWGGWYVTGDVGNMRHRGNQRLAEGQEEVEPSSEAHAALDELRVADVYPARTSDVVALLVLEHQTRAHNAIVWAGYEGRRALDYQRVLNDALGEAPGTPVASTDSRLERVSKRLVDALLHVDEPPLRSPLGKDSPFAGPFQSRGLRDERGRSLRDFDLKTRLFRYPLSYTIDSVAFRNLPAPVLELTWFRLKSVLRGSSTDPDAPKLSAKDREAILEILAATRADQLPSDW